MTEVICEISGNHGGTLRAAMALIYSAKWAGADAVKFQCFNPERLAARRASNSEVLALANGVPLVDLYRKTYTPREWFPSLIQACRDLDIAWFSSVFSPEDVAFLETLDCPRYKISAFEMLDWELIKAVKETSKPIVMSVRPTKNVTVLQASNYDGSITPLGVSEHGVKTTPLREIALRYFPMVEWHLKLPGVDTPDSEFSLTPDEMKQRIMELRK